jgi:GAF domain-containing protein
MSIGMLQRTFTAEPDRIKALERYRIRGSYPEAAFRRISGIATEMFRAHVAMVSLVYKYRVWFISHERAVAGEVPRDLSLCAHAILGRDAMVIPDTEKDPRFEDLPIVRGKDGVRFYAGAPLRTTDLFSLGALCVMDTKPRYDWDESKSRSLADLAAIVMDEMELWRMAASRERLQSLQLMKGRSQDGGKESDTRSLTFGAPCR